MDHGVPKTNGKCLYRGCQIGIAKACPSRSGAIGACLGAIIGTSSLFLAVLSYLTLVPFYCVN
eukprot:scaffold2353_cov167-Amphora_coffeaeformis.AAC.17